MGDRFALKRQESNEVDRQTLIITWARSIPFNLIPKTRQRATLPFLTTWMFYSGDDMTFKLASRTGKRQGTLGIVI